MDSPTGTLAMRLTRLCQILLVAGCTGLAAGASAQDRPAPLDVLELSASASSEVPADTAVVTLSVVREGSDVSALTQDADGVLGHALNEAKATPSITAFVQAVFQPSRTTTRVLPSAGRCMAI